MRNTLYSTGYLSHAHHGLICILLISPIIALPDPAHGQTAASAPDIIFLQSENENSQIYSLSLATENTEPVAITDDRSVSITGFAVHGEWLVYAQQLVDSPLLATPEPQPREFSHLILLNWRTQEKRILLDCDAYQLMCLGSTLRISRDGQGVFLENYLSWPPTVWSINSTDSIPQIVAQYAGIASIAWLSESHFLLSYRDDDHNTHEILYDITNLELEPVDLYALLDPNYDKVVAVTPDSQNLTVLNRTQNEFALINLADGTRTSYALSDTGFAPYADVTDSDYASELVWKPDGSAFLYFTDDGLFLYDLATTTVEPLWTGDEVSEARWNASGSQIVFVVAHPRQAGDLWLYDSKRATATSLALTGRAVQWLR
jgi:Tol biopolymer transport system component